MIGKFGADAWSCQVGGIVSRHLWHVSESGIGRGYSAGMNVVEQLPDSWKLDRMSGAIDRLEDEIRACRVCQPMFQQTATAHDPRPVPWLSATAPILIAGQAPGARVHRLGRPFADPSGDRLRAWLGVSTMEFYDRRNFAILPMAFCFPGYNDSGADLPPPRVCAQRWRDRVLGAMPDFELTLLVGGPAQVWHLGKRKGGVTETVRNWRECYPRVIPLPHPSWRNHSWLKRNPWFEIEVLPALRERVKEILPAV